MAPEDVTPEEETNTDGVAGAPIVGDEDNEVLEGGERTEEAPAEADDEENDDEEII